MLCNIYRWQRKRGGGPGQGKAIRLGELEELEP